MSLDLNSKSWFRQAIQDRELEDLLNAKLIIPSDRPRIKRHDVSRGVIKSLISVGPGISLALESAPTFLVWPNGSCEMGRAEPIRFSAIWRADNDTPGLENFLDLLAER